LNVEFLSGAEGGRAHRLGTTANVSSGGVYFTTSEWRDLSAGQELGVRLSGLSGYGAGPLFRSLKAQVTVLRVDPPREGASPLRAGVAMRFNERPCFEVYRWLE
jgi:hypothetical protein